MAAPTTLTVKLFSGDPFDRQFRAELDDDLGKAEWVRFLVCYFSTSGLAALSNLVTAVKKPHSKGLCTLTCACGYKAIQKLWADSGHPKDKLRCFVPLKPTGSDPADAKLLHSKMVVLCRPAETEGREGYEVVLYVGSHNWTGPGLQAGRGTPNVEASLRVIGPWNESLLEEVTGEDARPTGDIFLDALNHIERCYQLDSSTNLNDSKAEDEFKGWMEVRCGEDKVPPGVTVLEANCVLGQPLPAPASSPPATHYDPAPPPPRLIPRCGDAIYLQCQDEDEAQRSFNSAAFWVVMLWESTGALKARKSPWLLFCRPYELYAKGGGNPTQKGMRWLVFDPRQNTAKAPAALPQKQTVRIGGSPKVDSEYWSLLQLPSGTDSTQVNVRDPEAHVYLRVLAIRKPEHGSKASVAPPDEKADAKLDANGGEKPDKAHDETVLKTWDGSELPFHDSRIKGGGSGRLEFPVYGIGGEFDPERGLRILNEQELHFKVDAQGLRPSRNEPPSGIRVFPRTSDLNHLLYRLEEGDHALDLDALPLKQAAGDDGRRFAVRVEFGRIPVGTETEDSQEKAPHRIARLATLLAPGSEHLVKALDLSKEEAKKLRLRWPKSIEETS